MWLSFPDHTLGEEPSDLCPVLNLLQTLSLPLRLFTSEVTCFISGIYEKAPPLPLILFSHFCFLYPKNLECLSWGFSSLKLLLFLRGHKDMWKFLPDSGSSGLPMVYSTPEALPSLYHSFLGWSLPPSLANSTFLFSFGIISWFFPEWQCQLSFLPSHLLSWATEWLGIQVVGRE